MPIPNYNGSTFVAFLDISGFKEMMKHEKQAVIALDHFYTSGYNILQENQNVHGFFVSDCAILFVNNHEPPTTQIRPLLNVVDQLNRNLLSYNIMLTTSIAYGRFSYHQRFEFEGIEKNPVFGNAYVSAFLDCESGTPRIQPGECRIVKANIEHENLTSVPRLSEQPRHYYFFWMVRDEHDIEDFRKRYDDAYQQKYRGMLEALKDAANDRLHPEPPGPVSRR